VGNLLRRVFGGMVAVDADGALINEVAACRLGRWGANAGPVMR